MVGLSMARRTRSGTLVGPGIWRKCLPERYAMPHIVQGDRGVVGCSCVDKSNRNLAIDAYRGFVMLLMMAEVLELSRVSKALPGNAFWGVLAYHQTHTAWAGCSLHDTIQPGFSFLVGVALPYSIAARMARGGTFRSLFPHALWRSFLLVTLGIFLRSTNSPQTYF